MTSKEKSQVPTPHGLRALGDVGDAGLRGLLGARPADTAVPTHEVHKVHKVHFTRFKDASSFIISARKTDIRNVKSFACRIGVCTFLRDIEAKVPSSFPIRSPMALA